MTIKDFFLLLAILSGSHCEDQAIIAKSKWEIVIFLSILRLYNKLCLSTCTNKLEKTSAHIKNRYRHSRHPCLKPLWECIRPFATLFIKTEKEKVVIQSIIKFIHLLEKPNLSIICFKKDRSTLKPLNDSFSFYYAQFYANIHNQ